MLIWKPKEQRDAPTPGSANPEADQKPLSTAKTGRRSRTGERKERIATEVASPSPSASPRGTHARFKASPSPSASPRGTHARFKASPSPDVSPRGTHARFQASPSPSVSPRGTRARFLASPSPDVSPRGTHARFHVESAQGANRPRASRGQPTALAMHVRTRLVDGRTITPSPEARRTAASVIFEIGQRYGLLGFAIPGSHLHSLLQCNDAEAGRFIHAVECALHHRLALPVSFRAYDPEPVRDQRHLRTSFKYVLTQYERHDLVRTDPLREGTSLPDLLGLRLLGAGHVALVRRCLPDLRDAEVLGWLGMTRLWPAAGPPDRLIQATLVACGLSDLRGKGREPVLARRAAAEIARGGLPPGDLAALLGITPRTLRWMLKRPADPRRVEVIARQLGWMHALVETGITLPR